MHVAEEQAAGTPAAPATAALSQGLRQFIWDGPTRLFHWLLVGLIGFSWWSAENFHMDWHYKSGVTVCGLLVFRVLWGVFGASTARFRSFVRGPRGVWRYVRGAELAPVGHNPLGGWSVVALLLALLVQVTSGLFSVDVDGIESGPLSYLVDFDQGRLAAAIHDWSFYALLGLIALHVLAVFFYLIVKRRNLIGAMITGYHRADAPVTVTRARWITLMLVVAAAAAVTWWIAGGARV